MEPKVWSCKSRYPEPDWEPENRPTLQFTQNLFANLFEWKAANSGRKLQQLHVHNKSTNYLV